MPPQEGKGKSHYFPKIFKPKKLRKKFSESDIKKYVFNQIKKFLNRARIFREKKG